jgi:hypothetical protein
VFCPHNVSMCFVWIWEQTAIISLHDINLSVFIPQIKLLKPSGHYMYHQLQYSTILRSGHTAVFMCFVWNSKQTAIISLYNINLSVFITEIKLLKRSGHCMYLQFNIHNNSTFCPHSAFMCFVWIWEQTAIISLYSINWLVFITEAEECLQRGTNWIFKPYRHSFVIKRLMLIMCVTS